MPALSPAQLAWLGERVFQNECNGRFECLSSWNPGEDFPSLGIGHFIWFPAGTRAPFQETFPDLLDYLQARGQSLPGWLQDSQQGAPWSSRQQFYAEFDTQRMRALRQLLADSKALQVEFIVARLQQAVTELVAAEPAQQQAALQTSLQQLAAAAPPMGLYALIDYVHFKGTGLNPRERYQGQGWGLQQVLKEMAPASPSLGNFVRAAETVLERRVRNAPPERNEQRWLAGWKQRLQTYLAPVEPALRP